MQDTSMNGTESSALRRGLNTLHLLLLIGLLSLVTFLSASQNLGSVSLTLKDLRISTEGQNSGDESKVEVQSELSACLLTMDDNHWLVEWLAYYYVVFNLRHLIMTVDPNSKTSPVEIVERWKGRINIDIWNDTTFYDPTKGKATRIRLPEDSHRARQRQFVAQCTRTFKRRNHTWLMTVDTDEFLVINPRVRIQTHSLFRENVPSAYEPGHLMAFVIQEKERNNLTCTSMGRLQFSPDESPEQVVEKDVPTGFNGSDFLTLRFLKAAKDFVGPKNVLDLRVVNESWIPVETHIHQIIPEICGLPGFTWHSQNSLMQVHHYLGTVEQDAFRDNDARLKGRKRDHEKKSRLTRYAGKGREFRDDPRPWLSLFVKMVGKSEALRLLEGVGRTTGWANASATIPYYAPPLVKS